MTLVRAWIAVLFGVLLLPSGHAIDLRGFQHGIQLLELSTGQIVLLWSSSPGSPPEGARKVILEHGGKCGYFTHDIYYSFIDRQHPAISPRTLISLPEAQEPVSAAVAGNGNIAITFEDGSESKPEKCQGVIHQRYQIFDSQLKQVSSMLSVSKAGAHSGHISSSNKEFLVIYGEGWADDGGVNNLGTGRDIFLDIFDDTGQALYSTPIAVDADYPRDWWPLIASSEQTSLLVWQRIEKNRSTTALVYTVFDHRSRKLIKATTKLAVDLQYYHYDVQYLPAIDRFLVVGNYIGSVMAEYGDRMTPAITPKVFAVLMDGSGNIVDRWESGFTRQRSGFGHSYTIVRESSPAIFNDKEETLLVYPVKPRGVLILKATGSEISLHGYRKSNHLWFPLGTDGVFLDSNTVYFVNLTPTGVVPSLLKLLVD